MSIATSWLWGRVILCTHDNVRCIHGDEINDRGGKRRSCLGCGKALKGDLPEICYYTGKRHE